MILSDIFHLTWHLNYHSNTHIFNLFHVNELQKKDEHFYEVLIDHKCWSHLRESRRDETIGNTAVSLEFAKC